MLGWEYPPHISGGLGTACQGLTTALAKRGLEIDFVVPHLFGDEQASHMNLMDSYAIGANSVPVELSSLSGFSSTTSTQQSRTLHKTYPIETTTEVEYLLSKQKRIKKIIVPTLLTPYATPSSYLSTLVELSGQRFLAKSKRLHLGEIEELEFFSGNALEQLLPEDVAHTLMNSAPSGPQGEHYGGDLFAEVDRFTRNLLKATQSLSFDLIHAHDWMTYPAGIALSRLTGVPLVVHVHSLEYDRSGTYRNERIHQIERAGVSEAVRVVAVSHYTRSVVNREHGISLDKIDVVHNGVYTKEALQSFTEGENPKKSKIVLFMGRVTFQKGPDYFVEAAARVLTLMPSVKFVIAGSGDMLPRLIERVAELGISQNFVFTGFLKGPDVERILALADLYVMPSVSEPFGIAPLEAMSHDVPVIISKQSGVSEVLSSALKVDFWDVEKMANMIASVLTHPEIREDVLNIAREEIRRLHWDASAMKTAEIYNKALGRV